MQPWLRILVAASLPLVVASIVPDVADATDAAGEATDAAEEATDEAGEDLATMAETYGWGVVASVVATDPIRAIRPPPTSTGGWRRWASTPSRSPSPSRWVSG